MRGSDDNAALYWLARMLEGGETPLYVARRLVRFASEDIGEICSDFLTNEALKYHIFENIMEKGSICSFGANAPFSIIFSKDFKT